MWCPEYGVGRGPGVEGGVPGGGYVLGQGCPGGAGLQGAVAGAGTGQQIYRFFSLSQIC